MKKYSILLIFSLLILASCGGSDDDTNPINPSNGGNGGGTQSSWAIPTDQVFDGGPGKDGIPSVDNPQFTEAFSVNFLNADDLIVAIEVDGEVRGYPHPVLDWHEIVNDEINGFPFSIVYCPLTGTGTAWRRNLNGTETTFGVSGLLYNTNIIPYDRETDSNWSQMLLESVNGENIGQKIETYPVMETTWETFQSRWADALVLNTDTGFNRDYTQYPYGDYRTNDNNIIFPIANDDSRRPRKERGLGLVINGKAKYYGFENFPGDKTTVLTDTFEGKNLVLFGSEDKNFIIAFESRLEDGTEIPFVPRNSSIIEDANGDIWGLFGEAKSGPHDGLKLVQVDNFIGYWFAWGAFYPDIEIFE